MKNLSLIIVIMIIFKFNLVAQSTDRSFAGQDYSKTLTEFIIKEYLITELLNVEEGNLIGVEIDAITASKYGELTTVVYNCEQLNKKGLVFAFWSDTWNEYNTHYKGYAFRDIEYDKAITLFNKLDSVIENKKHILKKGYTWNAVFRWEDIYFVFYNDGLANKIRVFWKGFDSDWNQSNLKTTGRRFVKSFK
jgi:hypothetical protein